MLILNRMTNAWEARKCALTGEFIVYGDYFYEDSTDGICILMREYMKLKKKRREEAFDYSLLNNAKSEQDYKTALKKAEMEILQMNILSRPIVHNGIAMESGVE